MLTTKIEECRVITGETRNCVVLRTIAIVYSADMLHSRDQKEAGAKRERQ